MKRNVLSTLWLSLGLLAVYLLLMGCQLGQLLTPTPMATETFTPTPAPTETVTPSLAPTQTDLPTATPTATNTPRPTARPSPTSVAETGVEPIMAANVGRLTNLTVIRYEGGTNSPSAVAFIPDGSQVVVVSGNAYNREPPAQVQVHDSRTGALISQFEAAADERQTWLTSDGLTVMAYQVEGSVLRMYDALSGSVVAELSIGISGANTQGGRRWVSPDGWRVAFLRNEKTLTLWDLRLGRELTTVKMSVPVRNRGGNPLGTFSPDGRLFAVALEGGYAVYEAETGTTVATLKTDALDPDPDFIPSRIAFSPDSSLFALAGQSFESDGTLQLWTLPEGRPFAVWTQADWSVLEDLAFSPDGRWMAWAAGPGNVRAVTVQLFDGKTGKWKAELPGFRALTFSPDGAFLANAMEAGPLHLWDLAGNALAVSLSGHGKQDVDGLRFSTDGRRLVSFGREAVRLWGVPDANVEMVRAGVNVVEKSPGAGVFTAAVPSAWLTQGGATPRYELALDTSLTTLKSCAYTGSHTLLLRQQNIIATLTDLESNTVVAHQTFNGQHGALTCAETNVFNETVKEQIVSTLDSAEFVTWLKATLGPLGFKP